MEKKLIITMNQITGEIDITPDGAPTYAETLAMIEYAKMIVYKNWTDELDGKDEVR